MFGIDFMLVVEKKDVGGGGGGCHIFKIRL